jgi:hypothetical protein
MNFFNIGVFLLLGYLLATYLRIPLMNYTLTNESKGLVVEREIT